LSGTCIAGRLVLASLGAALLLSVRPDFALAAQNAPDALTLAEQAAAAGDATEVRQLLRETYGEEATFLPDARPPVSAQALLAVTTAPGERIYDLRLVTAGETDAAPALLAQAAAVLGNIAEVQTSGDQLTVRLAFSDTADLPAQQARLRAALPAEPELALLAAALAPDELTWGNDVLPLAHAVLYREDVNLGPAAAACEGRTAALDAAAAAPAGDDRLARVQARLWAADAEAWRAFCMRSRATYTVSLTAERPPRRWEVAAGATRRLEAEARVWRSDRLVGLAAAAALSIILFVAALWRASARPAGLTTENAEHTEN
jgi:hypothetical protein